MGQRALGEIKGPHAVVADGDLARSPSVERFCERGGLRGEGLLEGQGDVRSSGARASGARRSHEPVREEVSA